jgi:hypothetical protein
VPWYPQLAQMLVDTPCSFQHWSLYYTSHSTSRPTILCGQPSTCMASIRRRFETAGFSRILVGEGVKENYISPSGKYLTLRGNYISLSTLLYKVLSSNCRWASLRYKSALQTTKAPFLSAGLRTMSSRARGH